MSLLLKARYAALKRHKRRQQDGLWCEPGCQFHTPEAVHVWRADAAPIGIWTFLHHANVDQMTKEGLWE